MEGSERNAKCVVRAKSFSVLQGHAARVIYSPWFRFYYVVMVSINLFALVFTVELPIESAHLDWFIALEVFITAMLVIELILRVMAEGRYAAN